MREKRDISQLLGKMQAYAKVNRVPVIAGASKELLVQTVAEKQPQTVLEIGTAIGYSTLLIWEQLPENGKIITLEREADRIETAKLFLSECGVELGKDILMLEKDANDYLQAELDYKIDFLFLDAGKGHYLQQLKFAIPFLNRGAIIFADNVYFRGLVLQENDSAGSCPRRFRTIVNRMRDFIGFMQDNVEFETNIYKGNDGVLIARYKL